MNDQPIHKVDWQRDGTAVVVRIAGRVDSRNAFDFDQEVHTGVLSTDETFVLDCSSLHYISSAGLRVMLKLAKAFSKPKRFALCGLTENITEIITISGFDRIISIFDTAEQALANA